MRCTVIIPAAGSGARFGSETPKQYLPLRGRPLIVHAIERFLEEQDVERVIVCAGEGWLPFVLDLAETLAWRNVVVIPGGATRRDSVMAGLEEAERLGATIVAVHDSVRPFFRSSTFKSLLEAAQEIGAALPAIPVSDTIHQVSDDTVIDTPERAGLFRAQTPQCFRLAILRDAMERAARDGYGATDEAGAVARIGQHVRVVLGDFGNIKITHPDDLAAADANFERWSAR
jgi:2-C-methyl-D-erythritol 4-phosphate cytidylyltransferase